MLHFSEEQFNFVFLLSLQNNKFLRGHVGHYLTLPDGSAESVPGAE
jgi:hypothetical protein